MDGSYWDQVKALFQIVEIGATEEAFNESIVGISRSRLIVWAAHFCLSEIHNGGLLQFFWNTTGMIGPEAIEGFERIGMTELSGMIRAASALLGDPYPRLRQNRWDALLVAGGCSETELQAIFVEKKPLYLAFLYATNSLDWELVSERIYLIACQECGGFNVAATRFLAESY